MTAPSIESARRLKGMGKTEFIALMAMLMALNALAIDIMLPGLQEIGASLGVENENHRQYVISAYLIGFAFAQLIYGPIADRFGRRLPMFAGLGIYIVAAFAAVLAPSFGALLALRFVQGIGSAAMRVITVSIVRDVFGGRAMAEVMSLIMMVFMVIPVLAPGIGQIVMVFGDWHLIFIFMGVIAAMVAVWMYLRLPETLAPEDVRPFTASSVLAGFRIVLTNRVALCYTLRQHLHLRRPVRLHQFGPADLCRHLRARRLVPRRLCRRRRVHGPLVLRQCAGWSGSSACGGCRMARWSGS